MKRSHMVLWFAVVVLLTAGSSISAAENDLLLPAAQPAAGKKAAAETRRAAFFEDKPLALKGTVEGLDFARRTAIFKSARSDYVITTSIGEQVRNLPELAVGDLVLVKYYQATAIDIKRPGKPAGKGMIKAKAMPRPVGMEARQVTVTAPVDDINHPRMHVTIKGPDGDPVSVNIKDPRNIDGVKVGDTLVITYLEAVAISVEKVAKK